MTEPDELRTTLIALRDALDDLSVMWAIGGSLASAAYGEPRATNDVDIVATLDARSARTLTERLCNDFYADAEMALDAVRRRTSFNVIDERSFIKVDLFVPAPGAMGEGQLNRRRHIELMPGLALPVLGPEDVILQKLRRFDMTGRTSERQWRDLLSVLRAQDLDQVYLHSTAGIAGLSSLLDEARAEVRG